MQKPPSPPLSLTLIEEVLDERQCPFSRIRLSWAQYRGKKIDGMLGPEGYYVLLNGEMRPSALNGLWGFPLMKGPER